MLDHDAQNFYDKRILKKVSINEFFDESIIAYENNVRKLTRKINDTTVRPNSDLLDETGEAHASKYFKIWI